MRPDRRRLANTLGFGCVFADLDLDGALDLVVANGHIDETVRNIRGNVGYAQAPHLFLNQGNGTFRDGPREAGSEFARHASGAGWRTATSTATETGSAGDDQQRRRRVCSATISSPAIAACGSG